MNEIDAILSRQLEQNKTPSLHYLLFDQQKVLHRFQAGFADIKNQKEAEEFTTYNGYSVSKTFTALAILQLAEKGKINIDDPAKKFLGNFPYPKNITVRQLMAHSAGIPNPNPLSWIHLTDEHYKFDRNDFFKPIFRNNAQVKLRPNEKFSYSNLGYILLGQIIEELSGMSYENYISVHILDKLGLKSQDLGFTIEDPKRHAKGYHKNWSLTNWVLGFFISNFKFRDKKEGKWKPFKKFYVNGAPYGGLIGSPDAFMKYIQELLKPDCCLIKEAYKKMLFTENYTNNKKPTGMCLSWFKGDLNGFPYFAHAGGGGGYYCEIRIYPESGIGSVIMFNRSGMRDERFLDKVDNNYINPSCG